MTEWKFYDKERKFNLDLSEITEMKDRSSLTIDLSRSQLSYHGGWGGWEFGEIVSFSGDNLVALSSYDFYTEWAGTGGRGRTTSTGDSKSIKNLIKYRELFFSVHGLPEEIKGLVKKIFTELEHQKAALI